MMWRNPNRPASVEPEFVTPPAENGIPLATIPRGQGEQLRVSLAEFSGHPYISVRVWVLGQDGETWWPARGKGCSIRIREIATVGRALAEGLRLLEEHDRRPALNPPGPRAIRR